MLLNCSIRIGVASISTSPPERVAVMQSTLFLLSVVLSQFREASKSWLLNTPLCCLEFRRANRLGLLDTPLCCLEFRRANRFWLRNTPLCCLEFRRANRLGLLDTPLCCLEFRRANGFWLLNTPLCWCAVPQSASCHVTRVTWTCCTREGSRLCTLLPPMTTSTASNCS